MSCQDKTTAHSKKGVLRNFAKFTEKHVWQSLFFNKVAALSPETLLTKRPWHRWFPGYFAKFLRTPSFTEHLLWLLLLIVLQFLSAQSILVRKGLKSCIRNHLPYCSFKTAFQSKTRLFSLFRFKDIILEEISSHLVYKLTCSCWRNISWRVRKTRIFFSVVYLTLALNIPVKIYSLIIHANKKTHINKAKYTIKCF